MINMCMGKENTFDFIHGDGDGDVFKNIPALFHTAIYQIIFFIYFKHGAASGYFMCGTDKCDLHNISSFREDA